MVKTAPKAEKGDTPDKPKKVIRRDAVRTRARILQHATRAFAEKGYDGARVDNIARRAGVSVTLLYHYFRSKDGLFVAVMEEAYLLIRSSHRDIELSALPPREAISTMVNSLFDLFMQRPELVNLLNSENLHKARHIARSQTIRGLYRPLLERLNEVIARGYAEGVFRRRVEGSDFLLSLTGLAYFYFANRHTLGVVFDEDLMTPQRLETRRKHLVDFVLGYLDSEPAEEARSSRISAFED